MVVRILCAALIASLFGACGPLPQTIDEQRLFIEGRGRRLIEEWTASGDAATMAARLRVPMEHCFTGRATRYTQVQHANSGVSSHRLDLDYSVVVYEDLETGTISLAVQMLVGNVVGPKQPDDGMFLWHVDIRDHGPAQSELVYYGWRSGKRKQADALRAWSMGQEASCPPPD
jgi:hypothetical protein